MCSICNYIYKYRHIFLIFFLARAILSHWDDNENSLKWLSTANWGHWETGNVVSSGQMFAQRVFLFWLSDIAHMLIAVYRKERHSAASINDAEVRKLQSGATKQDEINFISFFFNDVNCWKIRKTNRNVSGNALRAFYIW